MSIKTVTRCPTCGSEVKVGGEGPTHYYIPIHNEGTVSFDAGDNPKVKESVAGKILSPSINDAASEYATQKITGGAISLDYVSQVRRDAFKAGVEFILNNKTQ